MSAASSLRRLGRRWAGPQRLATQVVFVDWHGVLSDDPFWASILGDPSHWWHSQLSEDVGRLFRHETSLVSGWMRGEHATSDVVATLEQPRDGRCGPGFLERRLMSDCRNMLVHSDLLAVLRALPPLTMLVIATDNMDCFADSVHSIAGLDAVFSGVLCSSDLGVLKAEDPQAFFGAIVSELALEPSRALLVDDSERNCVAFERWGGSAIRFERDTTDLTTVLHWAASVES